jgi:hypothetical protein
VRVRSRRLTSAAVEAARAEERSILRTWLMRMTVHLIPAEDYGWMGPLFAERILGFARRRLEALGVSAGQRDRGLAAAVRALERDGALTRGEVMQAAARTGFPVNAQSRTHLVLLLVVGGHACIGPERGRESVFVATRDWIGEPQRRERDESLAELARRYVTAFAPAGERDFSFWSGLPLRDCRAGLQRIAADLDELPLAGGGVALVPRGFAARAPRSPVIRLLPAYDTYLMGYASRAHAVDEAGERVVLPGGGVLRPTICVDGRFVGTWSNRRAGRRLAIDLEPFPSHRPLSDDLMRALRSEAADIGRFEDVEATFA